MNEKLDMLEKENSSTLKKVTELDRRLKDQVFDLQKIEKE